MLKNHPLEWQRVPFKPPETKTHSRFSAQGVFDEVEPIHWGFSGERWECWGVLGVQPNPFSQWPRAVAMESEALAPSEGLAKEPLI